MQVGSQAKRDKTYAFLPCAQLACSLCLFLPDSKVPSALGTKSVGGTRDKRKRKREDSYTTQAHARFRTPSPRRDRIRFVNRETLPVSFRILHDSWLLHGSAQLCTAPHVLALVPFRCLFRCIPAQSIPTDPHRFAPCAGQALYGISSGGGGRRHCAALALLTNTPLLFHTRPQLQAYAPWSHPPFLVALHASSNAGPMHQVP